MSFYESILIADDEKNARDGLKAFLESRNYDVLTAADGQEGWRMVQEHKPDLVLTDIRMPGLSGIELLEKIRSEHPRTKVILLTAYGSVEDAVKAMKKDAFYYLTKPVNLEELEFLVKKALSSRQLEEENRELREALFTEKFEAGEILAKSAAMNELLRLTGQVAQSNAAVLIEGESGTGKELIAHRIHAMSPRAEHPFVAVHCAALTETLLASELFGHEKGAFTGAVDRKIGRFERAHRGTIFLDEVGEISADAQVKLLRVLQDGSFERVGGARTIHTDARLISATNKNLAEEVRAGRFREDLYYRLNVIYLKVPPLRERRDDIAPLAEYFIRYFARENGRSVESVSPDAIRALAGYSWPGNVRELKNIVERMIVLSTGSSLTLDNVPEDIRHGTRLPVSATEGGLSAPLSQGNLADMERALIRQKLAECSNNKSLAAKKLGVSRRTLYRKIEEYGLKSQ